MEVASTSCKGTLDFGGAIVERGIMTRRDEWRGMQQFTDVQSWQSRCLLTT